MTLVQEIMRREGEKRKLIEDKLNQFQNLEEDPEFEIADRDFGDGAGVIATRKVLRAQSPKEFPKAELLYHDFGPLIRQMVYVIGRGRMYSGGAYKNSLFYVEKWSEISEVRDGGIGRTTFEDIMDLETF